MNQITPEQPKEERELSEDMEEASDQSNPQSLPSIGKVSKWNVIKDPNRRILRRMSQGELKLSNIIKDLQKFSVDEQVRSEETIKINVENCIQVSRRRLAHYLRQPKFHYSIIVLVIIDLIVVLIDLVLAQLSSPCLTDDELVSYNTTEQRDACLLPQTAALLHAEAFLFYFSTVVLIIFVIEIFLAFYAFGLRHYTNLLYLLDSCIVFASFVMEVYFHFGNIGRAGRAAAAIVVLRLWKIVRAMHAVVHSITLKNRMIIRKIQEAQTIIEEEKQTTEKLLEKQDIQVDYLRGLLRATGKLPSQENINNYVDKTWQQGKKAP